MAKTNKKSKKLNKDLVAIAVIVAVLLIGFIVLNLPEKTNSTSNNGNVSYTTGSNQNSTISSVDSDANQEGMLDTALTYYADIVIEDYGTITVKLDQNSAPITCANFVKLADEKFYDGLTFHRIIEDFMMQGGDPLGDGTGGSDEAIKGEFSSNGYNNPLSHTRGAISMARSSLPNSASSQFFIVHEDSTFLDGDYAVFGYVTEGMKIVDKICKDAKPIDNNGTIPSKDQPVITSISIRTE